MGLSSQTIWERIDRGQPVCVFVKAPLPRMVSVDKVECNAESLFRFLESGKLFAAISYQSPFQMRTARLTAIPTTSNVFGVSS